MARTTAPTFSATALRPTCCGRAQASRRLAHCSATQASIVQGSGRARFREAAPTGRGRKVPNDPLREVPRDAMWPARHDLHHNAAEPRSGARAAIIDRSSASRGRAWLHSLFFWPEAAACPHQRPLAKKSLNPSQTFSLRRRFKFVGFWESPEPTSMRLGITRLSALPSELRPKGEFDL